MIKNIFSIPISIFKNPIPQRLLVVFILPNVLVLGFTVSEINNNSNFLWRSLVGPYWFIEKTILFTLASVVVGTILYESLVSLKDMLHFENNGTEISHTDIINTIPKVKNNSSLKNGARPEDTEVYLKKKNDEWNAHVARCEARKKAQRDLADQEGNRKKCSQQQHLAPTFNDSSSENTKANALRDITGRGA